MNQGIKIGVYSGDMKKIKEDCAVLKPTFFPSVPRLYNRIFGKIKEKFSAATGLKGMLLNSAVSSKLASYKANGSLKHFFY